MNYISILTQKTSNNSRKRAYSEFQNRILSKIKLAFRFDLKNLSKTSVTNSNLTHTHMQDSMRFKIIIFSFHPTQITS